MKKERPVSLNLEVSIIAPPPLYEFKGHAVIAHRGDVALEQTRLTFYVHVSIIHNNYNYNNNYYISLYGQ